MQAVEQWKLIERDLGPTGRKRGSRSRSRIRASIGDAAAVLAPLGPGRSGNGASLPGPASGTAAPDKLRNLLGRLDRKRIWGDARARRSHATSRPSRPAVDARRERQPRRELGRRARELPPGWSDLLCELEVDSTRLPPARRAPRRAAEPDAQPETLALRFRVTTGGGYGTSPGWRRRCLERMDGDGITGRLTVLNVLSDTGYEATQGPVWRVAGRSV